MDSNQCKFCNKIFMNKGNLIKHQKTAKYCLEIQNKSDKEEKNVGDFNCKFCIHWADISARLTVVIDLSGWACVLVQKYCLVEALITLSEESFVCLVWPLTHEGTCAGSSLVKTEENNSSWVHLIGRSTEDLNTWIVNTKAGAPETPKNL